MSQVGIELNLFPTRPHCPHSISTPIPARTRGSGEGRCTVPPVPCAGGHLRSHGRVRPPGPAAPAHPPWPLPTFTNWWRPSSVEAPDRTPAIHASPIGDLAVRRPARIESRGAMLPPFISYHGSPFSAGWWWAAARSSGSTVRRTQQNKSLIRLGSMHDGMGPAGT